MSKIFDSFKGENKQGLDFREFVLCLAVCTKDGVKERIRAILRTYKDYEGLVEVESFEKVRKSIGEVSEEKRFKEKKLEFEKRVKRHFSQR